MKAKDFFNSNFFKLTARYRKGVSSYHGITGWVYDDYTSEEKLRNFKSADENERYFCGQVVIKGKVFEFSNPFTSTERKYYTLKNSRNQKIKLTKEEFYSLFE